MRKENSPTLLGFDTKQHIPESPAAPDIYRESRKRIITIRLLLAVLKINKSAECQSVHFYRSLNWEFTFSHSKMTGLWETNNPCMPFQSVVAPLQKNKKVNMHTHTHTKLGVQKGFPVVLYIRDVLKTLL